MVQFVFIALKLFEFAIFIIFGNKISKAKSRKEYWSLSSVPIFTYAIIEGLRFGRYTDWNLYYFRYEQLGVNVASLDDYEPLFRYICHILYQCHIQYPGFIFLQCLFFIFCVFVLIENFKDDCKWIIPLIIVSVTGNENFIRWYLSYSFLLLSINSLLKEKFVKTLIWFVCAFLCHSGIIIFGGFLILYRFLSKYAISEKLAICLLFITSFLLSISDLLFITRITSFLSPVLGESLSRGGYLDATEDILNGSFGKLGIMEQSKAFYIRIFIMNAPVIYWGRKIINKYQFGYFFYNIFVIGAIVSPLFVLTEIFNRISDSLTFFFCFVGGVYYYNVLNNYYKKEKTSLYIISIISLIFALQPYFSDIFSRPESLMLFLWDANGRNFLPYW